MLQAKPATTFNRYLVLVAFVCVATAGIIGVAALGWVSRVDKASADHFAALPLAGDYSWYLNLGGRHVPEIQDLDLFYHHIGHSIAEARKDDVGF